MQTNVEFQAKADELIALAKSFGVDAKIIGVSGLAYHVEYNRNVWSVIGYSNTNKVSVQSFERTGLRRTNRVSMNDLPEFITYYSNKAK